MLIAISEKIRAFLPRTNPWTSVYGLARTLLALSLAITLGFNDLSDLFMPRGNGGVISFECNLALSKAGLFCLAEEANAQLACGFAVLVLLVTASGWRPRITGPLHWYVAFSFQANANVVDGGDQLGALLALLLLPITLLDSRKSHWDLPVGAHDERRRLVGWWFFTLVRIQVAIVYFHAAVGKFEVAEWTDGTALYYWLLHPTFGLSDWLRPAILPVLLHGTLVALLTWSVLALEFMLAAGLIAAPRWRRPLLVGGFLLHVGIILVHGLISFSMVMFAALILFLHPVDVPIMRWLPRAATPGAGAVADVTTGRHAKRPGARTLLKEPAWRARSTRSSSSTTRLWRGCPRRLGAVRIGPEAPSATRSWAMRSAALGVDAGYRRDACQAGERGPHRL